MRRLAPGLEVRALVVDDLPENREVLCEMLSIIGCRVASAINGCEAVKSVRAFCPHIVFMDIRLPDMDGFQAAREIQKESGAEACKIVSFSGSAMDHERQTYLEAGFDDFLAKPLRVEMICESLRRLLKIEFEPENEGLDNVPTPAPMESSLPSESFSALLATLKMAAEESSATKARTCLEALEQMGGEGRQAAERLRIELESYDFEAMRNAIVELETRLRGQPSGLQTRNLKTETHPNDPFRPPGPGQDSDR